MKTRILLPCLFSFICALGRAADTKEVTIDELRTPVSPAFALLGITPSSIERPSTPRAFAATLASAAAGSDGTVPKDIAIEVAPYWWVSHPKLTFTDYYYKSTVGQNILHTLSLSLATTSKKNETTGKDDSSVGLGLRFQLLSGRPAPELAARATRLESAQTAVAALIPDKPGAPAPDTATFNTAVAELNAAAAAVAVAGLEKKRVGWTLDFATAVTSLYPEGKWADGKVSRVGAWLTPAYRLGEPTSLFRDFTFLGVCRYLDDRTMKDQYMDYGARVVWHGSDTPIDVSVEYLRRNARHGASSERYCAVVEYVYSADWSLVASYGKNFKNDTPTGDTLIALLGVKLGLGKGPVIKVPAN